MALVRGLVECSLEPVDRLVIAHVHHHLRGPAADADAAWVEQLGSQLGIKVHVGHVDAGAAKAVRASGSREAAARAARYEWLEAAAGDLGCSHLAVAHTADDQAETILHHVVRGTGLDGLRGMPASRPLSDAVTLVRPLLEVTRGEVIAYLEHISQDSRHDATNDDLGHTRNRIRHELLPLLEREFNPRVREALVRLARQAADVEAITAVAAETVLERAVLDETPDTIRLDAEWLMSQPRPLVRECLKRLWIRSGWPRGGLGFDDWERLADTVCGGPPIALAGRIDVRRRANLVVISRQSPADR